MFNHVQVVRYIEFRSMSFFVFGLFFGSCSAQAIPGAAEGRSNEHEAPPDRLSSQFDFLFFVSVFVYVCLSRKLAC